MQPDSATNNMLAGDMDFTIIERLKILLGARLYLIVANNRPVRAAVSFSLPSWIGPKIGNTFTVPGA